MKANSFLVTVVIVALLGGTTFAASGQEGAGLALHIAVAPQQTQIGTFVGINATYTNFLDIQITGIAIAAVHDSIGQTVAVFAGTFMLEAGDSIPVYIVFYPWLPSQTYSVQVYVITPQGGVISPGSTITVTT